MSPRELYDRALAKQLRRKNVVVARIANVTYLRDRSAVYGADGRLLFRIPMKPDALRIHALTSLFLDALMLLNHEAPETAAAVLSAGTKAGWARWDGRAFTVGVTLCGDVQGPEPHVADGSDGEMFKASLGQCVEVSRLIGGSRRLAAAAKTDPEWFAQVCGAVFIPPKKKAERAATLSAFGPARPSLKVDVDER